MATRAEIRARVADILARDDLSAQIDAEIDAAHRHYAQTLHPAFMERRDLRLVVQPDSLWHGSVSEGGQTMPARVVASIHAMHTERDRGALSWRDAATLATLDVGTASTTHHPTHWSRLGDEIGLWPRASADAVVLMVATLAAVPPGPADADVSPWTLHAPDALTMRTAAAVAATYIVDLERAQILDRRRDEAERAIRAASARHHPGIIRSGIPRLGPGICP